MFAEKCSYLVWLRQYYDGHGSCVDALHAGRQAHLGDPLHPVRAPLKFQPSVNGVARHSHRCMV